MKANFITLLLFLVTIASFSKSHANQKQEEISVDFLEFLADMDEVTGDGFENWLNDESVDIRSNSDESFNGNTKIENYKDE